MTYRSPLHYMLIQVNIILIPYEYIRKINSGFRLLVLRYEVDYVSCRFFLFLSEYTVSGQYPGLAEPRRRRRRRARHPSPMLSFALLASHDVIYTRAHAETV